MTLLWLILAKFDLSSPLGLILALLGAAVVAGGVAAYFKSGLARSTIELMEKKDKAQKDRIEALESEVRLLRDRITTVEEQNIYLRELATGTRVAEKLEGIITRIAQERDQEHAAMLKVLGRRTRG